MRVLFTNTNRNKFLMPAPIGAMLVADYLRRDGHDVRFVDLMHVRTPELQLSTAIQQHQPELLCFSIRNMDNQDMKNLVDPLPEIRALVNRAQELSKAPTLIGGTAVTTFPTQMRDALNATYAFAGDDPELMVRFVASLACGTPDTSLPGLVYEQDGEVHHNPAQLSGYRGVRFGGYDLVDLRKYRKGYYDCGVVTRSGCPLGCVFCDAHVTFGRDYVLRDPLDVVDEMKELKQGHKARSLWMVDSGFNRPLDYAKELAAMIAEQRPGVGFSCIVEPGEFDAELARLLRKVGCQAVMIFGTTLSDAVLERNAMPYRSADIVKAARLLDEARVSYMLGFMFGMPGETLHSVEESLEKSLEIKPVFLQCGVGFRIQPETPLRDIAVEEGVIGSDDDCFSVSFYCSKDAPPDQILRRIKRFKRTHPWLMLRMVKFVARTTLDSIFGY